MKVPANERIPKIVTAHRKGRGGSNQTPLEVGIGYLIDEKSQEPTKQIVLRIVEASSGIPPVVAVFEIEEFEEMITGSIDAVEISRGNLRYVNEAEIDDPVARLASAAEQCYTENKEEILQGAREQLGMPDDSSVKLD